MFGGAHEAPQRRFVTGQAACTIRTALSLVRSGCARRRPASGSATASRRHWKPLSSGIVQTSRSTWPPRLCSPRRRKGLDDQEYLIIHQSLKRPAKEEIVEEVSNQLSNNRSGRRYTSGDCPAVSSGRKLRALALSPFVRQRLTMVTARQRASDLERLTKLIEAGTVTPSIGATYPLDQVPDAMRHLEAGEARGKIAITI